MNPRLKFILLIIAAAIIVSGVAAAVYVFVLQPKIPITSNTNTVNNNAPTNTNTNTNAGLPNVNGGNTVNTNTPVNDTTTPTPLTDDRSSILRLARIFVERYGTFSNRNNFENITNLEPLMTEKFQKESAKYINENQNSGIAQEYYGITTTVASSAVEEFNDKNNAVVRLGTRRVETLGEQDPTVFTQDVLVRFQYVGDAWKVHTVEWQ